MTLINATMMIGLLLSAVPVVLHLIMRAKPKRIEFPALRLLRSRKPANSRRMRLRHWLLLILRSLLIAVVVLALARPSLPAARYGLRWWEWLLLAVVTVGAFAVYRWLNRSDAALAETSTTVRDSRYRRRLWCVTGGLTAALIFVGLPWAFRVRAELLAPRNEAMEDIPVAAVFVFDTSLSMNYRHENLTRLERAREVAVDYLRELPPGSRVAIAGLSQDEEVVFQADLAGAHSRMESLTPTSVPESLNRVLKSAIDSHVDDRDRVREELGIGSATDVFAREILVLTDLSQAAWAYPDESSIADALARNQDFQVYVIDVGAEQPNNISLSRLRLSDESSVPGRQVIVNFSVSATEAADRAAIVEVFRLDSEGNKISAGAPRQVVLTTGTADVQMPVETPPGTRWVDGFVRLQKDDPLADDSIRYFTFGVRPKPRLLFISDMPGEDMFLRNALQPAQASIIGLEYFDCTSILSTQVSQYSLQNFDVVCLINHRRPDAAIWTSLREFAESGGGVLLVAGSKKIEPLRWRSSQAASVLPALPVSHNSLGSSPAQLRISDESHSMTRPFMNDEAARTELSRAMFFRCWTVDELQPNAQVLMTFSDQNQRPALLSRRIGEGRCVLFTSALDNLASGGSEWTDFVVGDNWAFFMWSDVVMQFLTGAADQPHNFTAGRPIEIAVPPSRRFSQFLLRRPGGRQTQGELPLDQSSVLIDDAFDPGQYNLRPRDVPGSFDSAFSVNMRDEESDLTPISMDHLVDVMGKDRFSLVRNPAELQQAVRVGRLGVEIFPVLLGLALMLFCAEHLVANFFYDEH